MAWIQVVSNPFAVPGDKAGTLSLRRRATGNVPAGLARSVSVLAVPTTPTQPAPAGTYRLAAPAYVSTSLRERASKRVVRTLVSNELQPAGDYTPTANGLDDNRVPLPLPASAYEVIPASHQQSVDTEVNCVGLIGNTSENQYGPHAYLGLNIPDDIDFCKGYGFLVCGYAEGTPVVFTFDQTRPNFPTRLHAFDTFSPTGVCNNGVDIFIWGIFVFQYNNQGYRGRGVYRVDGTTRQDKPWTSAGAVTVATQYSPAGYVLLDTQFGADQQTSCAATLRHLYATHPNSNDVLVYSLSTEALVQTLTFPGLTTVACRDADQFWVGNVDNSISQYTEGNDGSLTATGLVVRHPLLTSLGKFSISHDKTRLLVANVAERYYSLSDGVLKVDAIYLLAFDEYDQEVRVYQGPADQSHTIQEWRAIWLAEGEQGGANFAYRRTLCESTKDHRVLEFSTRTGELLHQEGEGDYGVDATVAAKKFYFSDTRRFLNGGAVPSVVTSNNGHRWVNDFGNSRIQHYDENWNYIDQISWLGTTSNIAGHRKQVKQIYLRFKRYGWDYVDGVLTWFLDKNYSNAWAPGSDENGIVDITTYPDGQDYGLRRAGYKRQTWRITDAKMENTGVLLPGDLGSNVDDEGNVLYIESYTPAPAGRRILRQDLSFANGNPQYVGAAYAYRNKASQPANELPINSVTVPPTADGTLFFYEVESSPAFPHVALLRPNESDFAAQTAFPLSRDYPAGRDYYGPFLGGPWYMNASASQRQGSFMTTIASENLAVWGEKLEFYLGGGQANKYKASDNQARVTLVFGEVRDPAFSYEPGAKGQGGNGDAGIAHRMGDALILLQGAELGNGVTLWVFPQYFSTLVEHPPIPLTAFTPDPVPPGRNLLATVPRYSYLTSGDGGLTFSDTVLVETDREWVTPAGGAPDVLVKMLHHEDFFRIPWHPADLGSDKASWTLFFSLAYKTAGDSPYYLRLCTLRDEAGKAIAQLRRTSNDPATVTALRLNSVAKAFDEPSGGLVLNQKAGDVEARELYYYDPFVLQSTPAGLTLTSRYGTVPFELKDPAANRLRPASLGLDFETYGNGQNYMGFHDVRFLIS